MKENILMELLKFSFYFGIFSAVIGLVAGIFLGDLIIKIVTGFSVGFFASLILFGIVIFVNQKA